jgi:hypothetical protein|tara:strand:+ start:853 stop:1059 length:207 start_codon:yes stop_codon:yes gene_type:complete
MWKDLLQECIQDAKKQIAQINLRKMACKYITSSQYTIDNPQVVLNTIKSRDIFYYSKMKRGVILTKGL